MSNLEKLHDSDQAVVVVLFDLSHQAFICHVNEVIEFSQVMDNMVQQMFFEDKAPTFNAVQQTVFERLAIHFEPLLQYYQNLIFQMLIYLT